MAVPSVATLQTGAMLDMKKFENHSSQVDSGSSQPSLNSWAALQEKNGLICHGSLSQLHRTETSVDTTKNKRIKPFGS